MIFNNSNLNAILIKLFTKLNFNIQHDTFNICFALWSHRYSQLFNIPAWNQHQLQRKQNFKLFYLNFIFKLAIFYGI